jgi:aspartyl/asparaginyl beta-hydroxylase (cupin superfamily)
MGAALQGDSATAASVREQYRETIAPQIRSWSILSANYRTLGIFVSALFKAPEYYFAFEIIGFSAVLAVLISRLNTAHQALLRRLRQPLSRVAARLG